MLSLLSPRVPLVDDFLYPIGVGEQYLHICKSPALCRYSCFRLFNSAIRAGIYCTSEVRSRHVVTFQVMKEFDPVYIKYRNGVVHWAISQSSPIRTPCNWKDKFLTAISIGWLRAFWTRDGKGVNQLPCGSVSEFNRCTTPACNCWNRTPKIKLHLPHFRGRSFQSGDCSIGIDIQTRTNLSNKTEAATVPDGWAATATTLGSGQCCLKLAQVMEQRQRCSIHFLWDLLKLNDTFFLRSRQLQRLPLGLFKL